VKARCRVPNSPTGQVLEAGPDRPVLVDVDDWTRLARVVQSGLGWSQTSLYKRSHESRNGTQAKLLWDLKAPCHVINQQLLNTS